MPCGIFYSNPESVAIRYNPKELLDIIIPSVEQFENTDFKHFIYGFVDYDEMWPFNHKKKQKVIQAF
ncbi:MAG: hypothetical protein HC905_11220 [Bacteroidales bacterium]|nr:hypothetical protein [Bacteroidales bacterium]